MKTYMFETLTGSHLYGLANENSDIDTFRAYTGTTGRTNRRGYQKIRGADDATEMPLGAWLTQAGNGVPQALEALWSPIAAPTPLDALRFNFRPNTACATRSYHNAILSMFRLGEMDDRKKRFKMHRHALRLTWNLSTLLRNGIFNPQMTPSEVHRASELTLEHHTLEQMQTLLTRESMIPLDFY